MGLPDFREQQCRMRNGSRTLADYGEVREVVVRLTKAATALEATHYATVHLIKMPIAVPGEAIGLAWKQKQQS